jgi:hypothetical protein
MIARHLRDLLRVRPGEERTAFPLLALMLVAMAGSAMGANGVESLFFSRFGPRFQRRPALRERWLGRWTRGRLERVRLLQRSRRQRLGDTGESRLLGA